MEIKNTIDFLVIGAQKSGTTSLFKYLSIHPNIYMPPEKEIDFFSDEEKFSRGVNWYLKEYFGSASLSSIWGEASPHYMCYEDVPERIFNTFPGIKLVAILRNPITRAYSHYRMDSRRKSEDRPLDVYVQELISKGHNYDHLSGLQYEYIKFGEYGRILRDYLEYFPIDKIKVIFLENLNENPFEAMEELFGFLDVSKEFKSDRFLKQYHPGGEKRFYLLEKILMSKWVKQPLRYVLPPRIRRALGFWLITQLTVKPVEDKGLSQQIRDVLRDYYNEDIKLLKRLFNIETPWEEFK